MDRIPGIVARKTVAKSTELNELLDQNEKECNVPAVPFIILSPTDDPVAPGSNAILLTQGWFPSADEDKFIYVTNWISDTPDLKSIENSYIFSFTFYDTTGPTEFAIPE